jgi:hypothetical protein
MSQLRAYPKNQVTAGFSWFFDGIKLPLTDSFFTEKKKRSKREEDFKNKDLQS